MNDFTGLHYWLELIREKYEWDAYAYWTNQQYTQLSEAIYQSTRVLISRNTIKNMVTKIVQGETDYVPRASTCQALAQFVGATDWETFKATIPVETLSPMPVMPEAVTQVQVESFQKKWGKQVLLVVLLLCMAGLVGWFVFLNPTAVSSRPYAFSIRDTVGIAPHTVTLQYDFAQHSDSSVLFDYDTYAANGHYEYKYLTRKNKEINLCYYWPGYYHTQLIVNGKRKGVYPVYIQSDGWMAMVYNAKYEKLEKPESLQPFKTIWPTYTPFDNRILDGFIEQGQLYVSKEKALQVRNLDVNYRTRFINYRPYKTDGDTYRFSMRFWHPNFAQETYCYTASVTVVGTKGVHVFQLIQPGCKLYAYYVFSEISRYAYTETIPGFEHTFAFPRTVTLINRNKHIQLDMDGTVFHTNTYTQSIGEIIGLDLDFKSDAAVDWIELQDGQGKVTYRDDFDTPVMPTRNK